MEMRSCVTRDPCFSVLGRGLRRTELTVRDQQGPAFPKEEQTRSQGGCHSWSSPARAQQLSRAGLEIMGSPDHKAMSWL